MMDAASEPGHELGRYENLIIDELCAFQTELEGGAEPRDNGDLSDQIPAEFQSKLANYRRCLVLLNTARLSDQSIATGIQTTDTGLEGAPIGYTLPSHIARFEIREQLGIGGCGIVFRGRDPHTSREVAIKIPRPECFASQDQIDRFAQEAAAAAQLDHPNILQVFESARFGVTPYIVMPFVPGLTLDRWRAEQSDLSPRVAAEIVRQLAEGVAHAHEHGILHRDLKPVNVLLGPLTSAAVGNELPFTPKLTDFGLAKCLDTSRQQTLSGALIGTPCYMSPEQAEGKIREITARTDVYGLGAVLYELLTGVPPFRGMNDLQTIQILIRDDPRPPSKLGFKVPEDLEVICLKCLEKSPANRYASARDLASDLQNFLQGIPIQARPTSPLRRAGKWCQRNPAWAALLTTSLVGVLTLIVMSLSYNARLSRQLQIAEEERRIIRQQQQEIRRRCYVADMREAKFAWDAANPEQMLRMLSRYEPRIDQPDLRDFAWWHLWRAYHEPAHILLGTHAEGAFSSAIAPDGRRAASGGGDAVIHLWSLESRAVEAKLHGHAGGPIHCLNFSPDGTRLVSAGDDDTVRVWEASTGRELLVLRGHSSWVAQAVFSPRGDLIASVSDDRTIRIWKSDTGEQLGLLNGHTKSARCIAFHPTEPTLASGSRDGTIRFWNLNDMSPETRFEDGMIVLVNAGNGARQLTFSPDGDRLVAVISVQDTREFEFQPPDHGKLVRLLKQPAGPRCLSWCRHGPLVLGFVNSEIQVFTDQNLDRPETVLRGHFAAIASLASSPDGKSLISTSVDGQVLYWPQIASPSQFRVTDGVTGFDNQFDFQWAQSHLAVMIAPAEIGIYRMPEKTLERTIRKEFTDGFALSPSGRHLLLCSSDGIATYFRVSDGSTMWTLPISQRMLMMPEVRQAIDVSESYAAVACNNSLEILRLGMQPAVALRLSHPNLIRAVAFLANDDHPPIVITACDDGKLRFWDADSGELIKQHRAHDGRIFCMDVSNDQRFIATGGEDRKIRVSKIDNFEQIALVPCKAQPSRVEFMEGAEILAINGSNLTLWSVSNEVELQTFTEYFNNNMFAVSPDGKQLAVPAFGTVHILNGRPGH